MSQEPTYPADSVPGQTAPSAADVSDMSDSATAWKKASDAVSARPWQTAGVAIGIGSAAVAAALLYANRTRRP